MIARRIGGGLLFLLVLVLLLLVIVFALGGAAQGEEVFLIISVSFLPLVALLLATAWALWTGRRVRPVLGTWILVAGLVYSALFAGLTFWISWWVRQSTSFFAAAAFVVLLPFWPVVVFLMLLAWWLLRRSEVAFAPYGFIGIALAWLVTFAGAFAEFLVIYQGPMVFLYELLTDPMEMRPVLAFFLALAFFLTPAMLALGLARMRR